MTAQASTPARRPGKISRSIETDGLDATKGPSSASSRYYPASLERSNGFRCDHHAHALTAGKDEGRSDYRLLPLQWDLPTGTPRRAATSTRATNLSATESICAIDGQCK